MIIMKTYKNIKKKLEKKILPFYIKKMNKVLTNELNTCKTYMSLQQMDIINLINNINDMTKRYVSLKKYHDNLSVVINCPMCHCNCSIHRVYNSTSNCVVCKDRDIQIIYSTTCGHVLCSCCFTNIKNNYNLLKG